MEIKLNLIPEYRKEEIRQTRRFGYVLKWEIQFSLILILLIIMLFSLNYMVKANLQAVIDENGNHSGNTGKYEKTKGYDNLIKDTNTKISEIEKIQGDQLYWSNFFAKINNANSEGITMETISNKDYSITLSGKAETRDKLIAFKEILEKNNCFSEIILPFSDILSEKNVEFKMELKIKPECIK